LANSPEEKHAQVINGNLPKIENSRPRQPRKRFIPPIRKRASTLTQHIDVADRANDNYENKTDNVVKSSSGGLRSAAELIRQTRAKLLTTDTAQNSTRCQSPTSIVANNISAISKTIKRITVAKQAVAINKKPRCIWKLPSQPTTIMYTRIY
jgi:hypothetical protein